MRIGINIDQILYRISGGTGRYSWNLIKSLAEIDNRNSYVLFHSRTHSKNLAVIEELNLGSNFSLRQLPFSRPLASSVWSRARFWPLGFFLGQLDLVHAPTFAIPAKGSAKLVVTVHDLAFLKFPEFYTARSLKFHQRSARIAASEADLLIAVSNSTKEDIISLLSVDEKRVKVIYEGVEIDKSLLDKKQQVLLGLGVQKPYILFVGTLEPRKNLVRLLQAFAALKRMTDLEHRLVIVGPKGWLYEEVFRELEDKDLKESVLLTDLVSDAELSVIMNQADLFVYPSLYEGFGLPPLEAMACGTPVLTSNLSSLPEVTGDAAILINPYDIDQMASAMINILEDEELKGRLAKKGMQRAAMFSWEKMARETLEAYSGLAQER
jgi:glycosyltransferase involved in cell wall biosynthesis